MDLKERVRQLKNDIPAVFLSLKDPDTPLTAKLLAGITVAYALSPIDLIPDFIPVIGYLDDILLLPQLITLTVRLIPREVWERNRRKAADVWQNEPAGKWYYALPVLLVWLLLIWLVLRAVL